MTTLKVKDILADEHQPRQYFNAKTMKTLMESIKNEGIISPLIVEEMGNGKYLLIDGERRFRSAIELGLTEVPVVIEAARDEKDRIVRQFAIQEMHEAWTPIEKAMAINNLSKMLNLTIPETCRAVGIAGGDLTRYTAFAQLVSKELYLKSEIPLDFAQPIRSLVNLAKKLSLEQLDTTLIRSDEMAIEKKIIGLVKRGDINQRKDITKLKDAFLKSPKSIKKFIENSEATPDSLFIETKAKGVHYLRNGLIACNYLTSNFNRFLEEKDVALDDDMVIRLKMAGRVIKEMLSLVE